MTIADKKFIYLVYAPELVHWSAGIKVLHRLNDAIKNSGRESYLINHGYISFGKKLELSKLVKKLNHNSKNYILVAIYPESIPGNPLGTENVIRWILNTPGLLGGPITFKNETIWSYSKQLADEFKQLGNDKPQILFIPAIDVEEIIGQNKFNQDKNGYDLLYAQKFRALGGIPEVTSENLIEITRFNKNSTTREETLSLVAGARSLHVFENSTIITEAQLLGVPVIAYKNIGFEYLIAKVELGEQGVSWDSSRMPTPDPDETARKLNASKTSYPVQLDSLLRSFEDDQAVSTDSIQIRFNPYTANIKHKLNRTYAIYRNIGLAATVHFIVNFIKRSRTRKP